LAQSNDEPRLGRLGLRLAGDRAAVAGGTSDEPVSPPRLQAANIEAALVDRFDVGDRFGFAVSLDQVALDERGGRRPAETVHHPTGKDAADLGIIAGRG